MGGGSISTGIGDKGSTGLSDGGCVSKNSSIVEAYGSVDELNSQIGAILSEGHGGISHYILSQVQHELFALGSDLASNNKEKKLDTNYVKKLTKILHQLEAKLDPLKQFIIPGGCKTSAMLHVARTICRRAERNAVKLSEENKNSNPNAIKYLNRLSDILFLLARLENKNQGILDKIAKF